MSKSFKDLLAQVAECPMKKVAVACAQDDAVLEAVKAAKERLKDYEESLPSNEFARVHRSYIVNISKISKIERYGQKQMLSLNNGEQIRISMTGYKILKEKLKL